MLTSQVLARLATVGLLWLQTTLASPTLQANRTTFETPSYYPGAPWVLPGPQTRTKTCHVKPAAGHRNDSAPAIIDAFKQCHENAKIVFDNATYFVNSVMETTGLRNVEIEVQGTLVWSTDIQYWLNNSLPMGYQNQSTAWIFSGEEVWLHGGEDDAGTFDGNGQTWYDFVGGISNYPRRPHQITFSGLTNSVIERLRFVQSQMWTMTLIHSENVLLQDICVHSMNTKGGPEQNTDGADTIYANNITFARWSVRCGDDNISQKANSTNILIEDCTFNHGSGVAMGSIGQYPGQYEVIENVTARNIRMHNTYQGGYIKTWTGVQQGYPPNGGGGGLGHLKNVTFSNWTLDNVHLALKITQCNSYIGATGECDTSRFQISNLHWHDISGTQESTNVTSLQCSGAAPCFGVDIHQVKMVTKGGKAATGYLCSNVLSPIGFKCTGPTS